MIDSAAIKRSAVGKRALVPLAVLFVLAATYSLAMRGCASEHYRPPGHSDITLDVSPSGDAVVFNADGAGGRDLYVLDLTSKQVKQISDSPEYEVWPSFSPDGRTIAYAAGVPGDRADHLFIRGVAGGLPRQLTHTDANDASPRFSPDGLSIAFSRDKTYKWGGLAANWSPGGVIYVVGADGESERQVTPDGVFAFAPQFSQDGGLIIFSTTEGVASIPIDGSKPMKMLARIPRAVRSPDGQFVAYFEGEYSSNQKLFLANADGTSKRLIASVTGGYPAPVFATQGNRLYFFQNEWPTGPTGVPKLNMWDVDVDGTNLHMTADYSLFDHPLTWKPATMSAHAKPTQP